MSSVFINFKQYKEQGLSAKEAAKLTGVSVSTAQKAYAKIGRVEIVSLSQVRVKRAIEELLKNPLIRISKRFDLTKGELVALYCSKEWQTVIKPARIAHKLKNDPYANMEGILERCSLDTMEALEQRADWAEIVDARKQLESAKMKYKELKAERKQLRESVAIAMPRYGFKKMTIRELNETDKEIPELYKRETKGRFEKTMKNSVLDLEHIQIRHAIRLLNEKIDRIIHERFKAIVSELNDTAEYLLVKHIGGIRASKSPVVSAKKRLYGLGMDMSKALELLDEERWKKYYVIYNDEIWDARDFEWKGKKCRVSAIMS